ncbi:molybdenum cofactor biosynthesis protein B [Microlunatus sp. Gsoil 973]|uniref:MogA/MoaB family molybdenum cofactor biosynthesis protein n=1 Tax=Microlunatus sp. Gsoil 973 TaxID=2672569 RepID=UPI0012B4C79D|nr:MogA/MoaB family molybdenum cofactor biosynthesis protein [Microlunatus sp. Gsoil 973]QGN33594.1 MogA/MoaB family molybdenum cofactor biosynthesis protein [Microlunatus sp. Gsoil 973]
MTDPARPDDRSAAVITVSTRASAGVYADRSGPIIVEALRSAGFVVDQPVVVPDGEPVADALRRAVDAGYAVIITNGGTGLNPNDHTPEMTRRVLDREAPELAAAIARYGVDHGVPTAVLSRATAGTAGSSLVVNLPGSSGGARDGMAVLLPLLDHAISQIRGGDH